MRPLLWVVIIQCPRSVTINIRFSHCLRLSAQPPVPFLPPYLRPRTYNSLHKPTPATTWRAPRMSMVRRLPRFSVANTRVPSVATSLRRARSNRRCKFAPPKRVLKYVCALSCDQEKPAPVAQRLSEVLWKIFWTSILPSARNPSLTNPLRSVAFPSSCSRRLRSAVF